MNVLLQVYDVFSRFNGFKYLFMIKRMALSWEIFYVIVYKQYDNETSSENNNGWILLRLTRFNRNSDREIYPRTPLTGYLVLLW